VVLFLLAVLAAGAASEQKISLQALEDAINNATYIDRPSRIRLNTELRAIYEAGVAAREKPGVFRSVFTSALSKLTILNVLYFVGALIVIGAMTLFITIGFGASNSSSIFSSNRCLGW
jgi:hypothetical protein